MTSGLEHLLGEGVISEVLGRLQSGKEAEVYVVRFGGKVVAAKVYKDRAHRSFKNNADYKEGRMVRNSRSQRAMTRGSSFGKAAAEDAWKTAEADALYKLHAAEVRVPTPVLYLDGVLLMELVLDAEGNAARRVIDTDLTPTQANAAYHDMTTQLVRILACDLIHGDLSPYNVLWAAAGPTVIDFPQIVSASHNSSSERFFLRDADNILGHFARIDRSLASRRGDPWEIWQAYRRRELTPDFRPRGTSSGQPPRAARPPPPPPRHVSHEPHRAPSAPQRAPSPNHGPPPGNTSGPRPPRPEARAQKPQGGSRQFGSRRPAHTPEVFVRPNRASLPPLGSPPVAAPAPRPLPSHGPSMEVGAREGDRPAETSGNGARPTRRRRRRR